VAAGMPVSLVAPGAFLLRAGLVEPAVFFLPVTRLRSRNRARRSGGRPCISAYSAVSSASRSAIAADRAENASMVSWLMPPISSRQGRAPPAEEALGAVIHAHHFDALRGVLIRITLESRTLPSPRVADACR